MFAFRRATQHSFFIFALLIVQSAQWLAPSISVANTTVPPTDTGPSTSNQEDLGEKDLEPICGDELRSLPPEGSDTKPTQRQKQCIAAKSAIEAVNNQNILFYAWLGLAGVCIGACASAAALGVGAYSQWVCMGSAVAVTAADATVTQQFAQSIMMMGGGIMMGAMMNQSAAQSAKAAAEAGEKVGQKDMGSCIVAAFSGMMAATRYQSMKQQEKMVSTTLNQAKALGGDSKNYINTSISPGGTGGPDGIAGAATTGALTPGASASEAKEPIVVRKACGVGGGNSVGTGSNFTGLGLALTQCALASDPRLPPGIAHPQFEKDFRTVSGQDLGSFFGTKHDPSSGLLAATAAALSPDQSRHLAAAVANLGPSMILNDPGSTYAGGGGGGGSRGGGGDEFTNMMAGFMSQLMPQTGASGTPDPNKGLKMVIYANQKKPHAVAEDPTLSIFDRITYRYYYAGKRMVQAPIAPSNAAANPSGSAATYQPSNPPRYQPPAGGVTK